jgi:tetratricopeptide (TPR) repeat protein
MSENRNWYGSINPIIASRLRTGAVGIYRNSLDFCWKTVLRYGDGNCAEGIEWRVRMHLSMTVRVKRFQLAVIALVVTPLPRLTAQQSGGQDPQVLAQHAQNAFSQGQYTIAEKDYRKLLQMGAHSAAVYSNLGVVYLREGKLDAAVEMLDKAKSLAPGVAGIRLNLGLAYFRRREFRKASTHFGEVLAMDGENVQARYLKGVCGFMMDDYESAVRDFEPIVAREENDLEFLFMLGLSYGMLHRAEESTRTFERLVEAGGDTPHLHLLLGKAYLALGQQDQAASELELATQSKALPFVHYYLGMLNRQQGQLDLAAIEFEKEIEIVPGNTWAYKELAELRMDRGDERRAIAVLQKGIAHNPDAPLLLATLGRAYLQLPDTGRAISSLTRAIALDPKNSSYHYQLGRAYLKAGRHDEANVEMKRARNLASEPPEGKMEVLSRDQNTETVTNESH